MRKFRFIGDDLNVYSDYFHVGSIYDADYKDGHWKKVSELAQLNSQDWEEVFEDKNIEIPVLGANKTLIYERPKNLHKDTDLGYFAGVILQGLVSSSRPIDFKDLIQLAKELIKQLDQEAK
jgi:hypothetical protein